MFGAEGGRTQQATGMRATGKRDSPGVVFVFVGRTESTRKSKWEEQQPITAKEAAYFYASPVLHQQMLHRQVGSVA